MRTVCSIALAFALIPVSARPAMAVLQFYKVFQAEYLDDHPDQEFAALVKKPANRCFVCHQGKKRTHHNAFGIHLVEPLDRRKDAKDKEKISAVIKQVLAMHVDPDDETSETYGDRLAASKWPGGELEELKKEPAE